MAEAEVLNTNEQKPDNSWYQELVNDVSCHLKEALTASNWIKIVAYHAVGSRILQEKKKFEDRGIYGEKVAEKVAKSIGINRQYVFDSVRFATMYPDLNMFPGDKSMTWNRVRETYLISPDQQKRLKKQRQCPKCGYIYEKKEDEVKQ